ncbi:T9SS type A sorting domain-containing protein [Chitinophaga polysaccharea]|uniref:T9SS type A sorting domain-containing protein n=1 Tax=Chitinophaga polysaccharea TaxID=1293035 RepID=UPI0014559FE5|nr:T9SS type A sorting domain-containing protein [Chitinophaga polysaccharea]NLR58820.1 T9SS type A sorting domain-containing protein [Chitinophaga polysaccharea]
MRKFCIVLLFVISCAINGIAQPSGLDSSFGVNGKLIYSTPSTYTSEFDGISVQPDGKIISVGSWLQYQVVLRCKPDGHPDSSFGVNGIFSRSFSSLNFIYRDIVLLSNSKILLGGDDAANNHSLFRLNSNGTPDSTFGNNGYVSASAGGQGYYVAMSLQPDGKIITMGTIITGAGNVIAIVRFMANGTVDSSFGINGRVATYIGNYGATPGAITVQPDGKILVGTQAYKNQQISAFACLRYLPVGSLDTTFNHTGIAWGTTGFLTYVKTMALQPDGKIILGGAINGNLVLQRLDSNGIADSSFGNNSIASADTCVASCMALRNNGSIVIGGYTTANKEDWAVMQFKPGGTLDSSFGQYGKIFTEVGPGNDRMYDIALQADGKVVACGTYCKTATSSGAQVDAAIVRYHSDGRLIVSQPHTGIIPDITLYPLPASDLLHIHTSANAAIMDASLYGMDGRCIAHLPINNNTLYVAGFPNGLYLLRLLSPSFSPITRRIIINH